MGLTAGQKALMDGINNGRKLKVEELLTARPELPVYGDDPVSILLFFYIFYSDQ